MLSPIPYNSPLSPFAARVACGGALLALACLAVLHFVRPDLDPTRRMISEYALGRHGWLMTLCFASYAVAGAGLAVALAADTSLRRGPLLYLGILFLVAAAAGPALAAVFPTDPASTPANAMSHAGKMHGLSFLVGVPGELLAMLLLILVSRHYSPWHGGGSLIALTSIAWLSVIVLGAAMSMGLGQHRPDPGVVGIANRAFMIAYGLWLAAAAWPLTSPPAMT